MYLYPIQFPTLSRFLICSDSVYIFKELPICACFISPSSPHSPRPRRWDGQVPRTLGGVMEQDEQNGTCTFYTSLIWLWESPPGGWVEGGASIKTKASIGSKAWRAKAGGTSLRLPHPPAAWRSRAGAGDGGDSSVSAAHSQTDVDGFLHLTETNTAGRGCNKRRGGRSRPSASPPSLLPAQGPHYPSLPHPRGRHSCLYRHSNNSHYYN